MTDELRRLHEAATPAPWRHGPLFWEGWAMNADGGVRVYEVPHPYPDGAHQPGVFVDPEIGRSWVADAALIAAARNRLPLYFALVDAARAFLAAQHEAGQVRPVSERASYALAMQEAKGTLLDNLAALDSEPLP